MPRTMKTVIGRIPKNQEKILWNLSATQENHTNFLEEISSN